MAEEILFMMGTNEFDYMRWAAEQADFPLKQCIAHVMAVIRDGAKANLARWPSPQILESYLDHADAIISLMAAQLLHHMTHHGFQFSRDLTIRVNNTLETGQAMDWRLRTQ